MEVEVEKPGHLQRIFTTRVLRKGSGTKLQRSIFLHGTGGTL